jgi:hypothetical protein
VTAVALLGWVGPAAACHRALDAACLRPHAAVPEPWMTIHFGGMAQAAAVVVPARRPCTVRRSTRDAELRHLPPRATPPSPSPAGSSSRATCSRRAAPAPATRSPRTCPCSPRRTPPRPRRTARPGHSVGRRPWPHPPPAPTLLLP